MKFKIIRNEFFFSALFKTKTRDFSMALLDKIIKLIKVSFKQCFDLHRYIVDK